MKQKLEFTSVSTTFRPISFRPLHRKQSLHWKQVGYFTGKCYFIRNGIQAYYPLHRKILLH